MCDESKKTKQKTAAVWQYSINLRMSKVLKAFRNSKIHMQYMREYAALMNGVLSEVNLAT